MTETPSRFPWWILVGAAATALAYWPTLTSPFDFVDDGNLVYPVPPGTTLGGHTRVWWDNVVANVEHLGPFRPTLWAHWHLQANLFGADPLVWRAYRLLWCALAAGMLLWLLRELRIPAPAALFTTAAAMWNPYRSEIWTSLTLSEAVAMPYALFALVAARKGACAARPLWWDLAGTAAALVALGCKNTFAAIVPAQVALRLLSDDLGWRDAWKRNGFRALALAGTLVLPAAHFVYFKLNWHPGQYRPPGPSLAQFGRVLSALKGGMGLDFLGAGVALATVVAARGLPPTRECRAAAAAGGLLAVCGAAVYLPMDDVSGRYTMPAVWGLDVLLALLLAVLLKAPAGRMRAVAVVALCAGLVAVLSANVLRQEKIAARARMLWRVVHHLESTAPPGAGVMWVSGDATRGALNAEEGIHVQWHLAHRGRADVRIGLFGANEQPLERVELGPPPAAPLFRISGPGTPVANWEPERTVTEVYQFGRKRYDCHISRPSVVRSPRN
ncbi:MAG: hypothetical protein J0I06_03095 [Planctomycetes bacterium]|nr:hypothetical protein [Planctomycetota bacterium]